MNQNMMMIYVTCCMKWSNSIALILLDRNAVAAKAICGIGVGVCPCSAYVADMVMCPLSLCVVMEKWHMMQLHMFIM